MKPTFLPMLLVMAGTSLAAGLPYIIGGDIVTDIRYWPWQGSLHQRFGDFLCGVTLISSEWAVTAASCVQSPPYDLRFGNISRNHGTVSLVKEIILHENYTVGEEFNIFNDIAALRISPLELSETIDSIKLGTIEELGNVNCYITGWGYTEIGNITHPDILHQAQVVINDCISTLHVDHLCTNFRKKGLCQGDYGGPLVCFVDGGGQLAGISSWAPDQCDDASVYTRVSYFREWIRGKTNV